MTRVHPAWCAKAHVCSVDRPSGEHRSRPYTVDTPYGRLVITRAENRGGARLEILAVVTLPPQANAAREATTRLLCLVHSAIAAADLGGDR